MIHLGRSITGNRDLALEREWVVTNGLGGYAMGTIGMARTRRYHGLLIAALNPPRERHVLLASVDTWVEVGNRRLPLVTHEWGSNVIMPDGYHHLQAFQLEGIIPRWEWAIGIIQIEQRLWMIHGENTTYITWHYQRGNQPIRLFLKPLITYREHHQVSKGEKPITVTALQPPWKQGIAREILVSEYLGENKNTKLLPTPFRIITSKGRFQNEQDWWWDFYLRQEYARGLDAQENLFQIGTIEVTLQPHETIALACTTETRPPQLWSVALENERQRQQNLITLISKPKTPAWIQQLMLAADQFIVQTAEDEAYIIGGYPWFGIWGRTVASITGLATTLGRYEIAATVLRTCVKSMDNGMLPNTTEEHGYTTYNTIDAALWLFIAVWYYHKANLQDTQLIADLYPFLQSCMEHYEKGTRFGIREDASDGLLFGGEEGIQLTWMDAIVDKTVVTPRTGKAVEINALWCNALCIMAQLAEKLNKKADATHYAQKAIHSIEKFNNRFWNEADGYLYDVIDTLNGSPDSTLRPNQLLALSLPFRVLKDDNHAKQVVDICGIKLLTSYGLRTLDDSNPNYTRQYKGSVTARDLASHQGTVWAWLMGAYVSAHLVVYNDLDTARSLLSPFKTNISDHGLGTISEIFDGTSPFHSRGAIAYAWSVAEILRDAWFEIERRAKS